MNWTDDDRIARCFDLQLGLFYLVRSTSQERNCSSSNRSFMKGKSSLITLARNCLSLPEHWPVLLGSIINGVACLEFTSVNPSSISSRLSHTLSKSIEETISSRPHVCSIRTSMFLNMLPLLSA